MLIEEIGEPFEQGYQQVLRTFRLRPGKYMILPHTAKMKTERHFLLRVYTTFPVNHIMYVHVCVAIYDVHYLRVFHKSHFVCRDRVVVTGWS